MRVEDIDAEIAAKKEEYESERAALKDQAQFLQLSVHDLDVGFKATVAALEGLKARLNGSMASATVVTAGDKVREIVEGRLGNRFSRMDIERELREKHGKTIPSRGAVVNELEALVRRRRLSIAAPGRGRRATIYERITDEDNDTVIASQ